MANIGLVLTDNPLYKNNFVNRLIQSDTYGQINIIIELKFKNPKTSVYTHYMRYVTLLGIRGSLFVLYVKVTNIIN